MLSPAKWSLVISQASFLLRLTLGSINLVNQVIYINKILPIINDINDNKQYIYLLIASMEPLIHHSFIGKSNTSFSLRLFGEMKSSNLHFEKVMSSKKKFMTNFEILIIF